MLQSVQERKSNHSNNTGNRTNCAQNKSISPELIHPDGKQRSLIPAEMTLSHPTWILLLTKQLSHMPGSHLYQTHASVQHLYQNHTFIPHLHICSTLVSDPQVCNTSVSHSHICTTFLSHLYYTLKSVTHWYHTHTSITHPYHA